MDEQRVEPTEEQIQAELDKMSPEDARYMQLVMVMQSFQSGIEEWLKKAESALHNHNVRMNVIETILCHPDFKEERARLVLTANRDMATGLEIARDGSETPLVLEDLQRVATEYVEPQLRERALKMEQMRAEALQKQQAAAQASPIINPTTGQPASSGPVLVGPDGRRVISSSSKDDE